MGKDTGTAEAFKIARGFIKEKLSSFLKDRCSDDIEKSFPLSHVPRNRAAIRRKLWDGIEEKTLPGSNTVRECRATLLFFSEWMFKEAIAAGRHIAYEDAARHIPLLKGPTGGAAADVGTAKLSHVKIKKIKGEKDWLETKLELLKLVSPMVTNYMDRAMIKRLIQETTYYLKAYEKRESPEAGKQQDLIFKALIFSLVSILHLSKAFTRKEAETITAALINEYCHWNPRISSLVRKLTQKRVSDLYDNSPLRRSVSFRGKNSD